MTLMVAPGNVAAMAPVTATPAATATTDTVPPPAKKSTSKNQGGKSRGKSSASNDSQ
jgi:hypothetical protein